MITGSNNRKQRGFNYRKLAAILNPTLLKHAHDPAAAAGSTLFALHEHGTGMCATSPKPGACVDGPAPEKNFRGDK